MSRRHAPTMPKSLARMVSFALVLTLVATASLSLTAAAQGGKITPRDIQWEWQLLTQRGDIGKMDDVPGGVGATLLMRAEAASGEGACSTYEATYSNADNTLSIFVAPEDIEWRDCDPTSRAFDEAFYANLAEVIAIDRADSVLILDDAVGDPVMRFTRAAIDNDPTAARWSLARIGSADGSVEPAIQGLMAWVEFLAGGSVVGSVGSGCGSFLGKYDTNEGRIDITDVDYRLTSTCPESGRAQAELILATLDEITDFQVRPAGLALKDELGTIRLALTPDLDVASRTWTPVALFDESGKQTYGTGTELTTSAVKFFAGKMEGRSICRPFLSKSAVRSGLAVSITDIKPVGAYCKGKIAAGQLGDIEAAFITALEETASYAQRGSELALRDVNGVTRALLEPQPPLTGTTWVVYRMRQGKRLTSPTSHVPITATFEDVDASDVGVLQGSTGVSRGSLENEYFGTFRTPQAAVIEVVQLEATGKACRGKQANSDECKAEALFLKLLQSADGYVARDNDLKFYKGRQNIIVFRPERFVASSNE